MDVQGTLASLARLRAFIEGSHLREMDGVLEDLSYMKRTWEWITAVLADAEKLETQAEAVKVWLRNLRDLAYEIERLVDSYKHQVMLMEEEELHPPRSENKTEEKPGRRSCFSLCRRATACCFSRMRSERDPDEVSFPHTSSPDLTYPSIAEKIPSDVRSIKARFDEIAKLKEAMHWPIIPNSSIAAADDGKSIILPHSHPTGSSLVEPADKFVGRDGQKKGLLEMLLSGSGGAADVIAVVGMGGVGKTTLCQHIYNDPDVEAAFVVKGWVHVGETFGPVSVSSDIVSCFLKRPERFYQLSMAQEKLRSILQGQRFLLVLDDVWCEDTQDWEKVLAPFMSGVHEGSKILVTTRNKEVAQAAGALWSIKLGCLSREDGWQLFAKHANIGIGHSQELVDTGKQISDMCQGLPLAIKVIGSLLRKMGHDVEMWKLILEDDFSILNEGGRKILEPLYLSYRHLPAHLKDCFKFFVFLQKGKEYETQVLIDFWMAHNLIVPGWRSSLKEQGSKLVDDFASWSFLERVSIDSDFHAGDHELIKVHDLIIEVAQYVSGSEFSIKHSPNQTSSSQTMLVGAEHLALQYCYNTLTMPSRTREGLDPYGSLRFLGVYREKLGRSQILYSKHLRVLIITESYLSEIPDAFYELFNLIKLDLSGTNGAALVSTRIHNLVNLRCLSLRYCGMSGILPSIPRLTALEELDLQGSSIGKLPAGITRLANLRLLNIEGTGIAGMPSGLSNLKKLKYLPCFPLGFEKTHARLRELGSLKLKGGSLHIKIVGGGMMDKQDKMANKGQFGFLQMTFEGSDADDVLIQQEQVLNHHLKPHANIRKLKIDSYKGSQLPSWMGDQSFDQLVVLMFQQLERCMSLSPAHLLPSLRELHLFAMISLEEMIPWEDSRCSTSTDPVYFPKLELLGIKHCPSLRIIRAYKFMALQNLRIHHCCSLESVQFVDPSLKHEHQEQGDFLQVCFSSNAETPESREFKKLRSSKWTAIRFP